MPDTIYALATAPGRAGVAIIRLSGPDISEALSLLKVEKQLTPRMAHFCTLHHPEDNTLLDDAVLLYFKAPASFTGEDVLELHIHGSQAVIQETLSILSKSPLLRHAEPGEFSKRAFLNGKMDLTQAEGLADLIDAETRMQQRQAIRQLHGELGSIFDHWRTDLIQILALLEAYIDFPDEDIPESVTDDVTSRLDTLQQTMTDYLNDARAGERLREGCHVAILGSPNVGKSTLINYLTKRDLAITSDIAGTTRDVLEVSLDIEGYPFVMYDTAGIRDKAETIEQEGIRRAKEKAKQSDLNIVMFDVSNQHQEEDFSDFIDEETIVLFNKTDLCTSDIHHIEVPDGTHSPISLSLKEGKGIDLLLNRLTDYAANYLSPSQTPQITRLRHRQALESCVDAMHRFSFELPIELASEELRHAAFHLGSITGKIDVDEILDNIFSRFCIGK